MATQQTASVVIIGLGYVGLTLAVALARKGVRVYGVERRREVVDMVNEGRPPFSEIGLEAALTNAIESGRLTDCHSTECIPPAQYYILTVGKHGRAHVSTPVTNSHLVCSLPIQK